GAAEERAAAGDAADSARPAGFSHARLRHVSHDSRDDGGLACGSGSHASGQPDDHCRGHAAEQHRQSCWLDSQRAEHQAGLPHAAQWVVRLGSAGPGCVPGDAAMTASTIVTPVELTESDRRHADRLEEVWKEPAGFLGWFKAVHHTTIGKRYMVTAFVFFALAGLLAGAMRLQLAFPEAHILSNDKYNQFFTVHGSTMMFLFAVPMMFEALSVYLVPLMVGTRNIAFPRLNAYSYYLYLFGGMMLWIAFFCNTGADRGWFSYVPLAGPDYGPGKRPDFWAQMITFTEVSALAVAVEIVVTVFRLRAPGMSLNRIPIFVWGQVVVAFMVIFALPGVVLSSTMLLIDRTCGTQFFNPAAGGDVLLYQHLFWWFGHPEVYIIFIPGTAIVSTIVTTFSRRHMFGYLMVVLALV